MKYHFAFDSWLNRKCKNLSTRFDVVETSLGAIRILDVGKKDLPTVLMAPDGPCVIEHFEELVVLLSKSYRVLVMDMPGFGFSRPSRKYDHSFSSGAKAIEEVLKNLNIKQAILNFTCANGFYALAFAKKNPEMTLGLVLGQTPSYDEMLKWSKVNIPRTIKIPFLGQLVVYFAKIKIASIWYKAALPKGTDLLPWQKISKENLSNNGCNCLASVAQGIATSSLKEISGVSVPVISHWGENDWSHRSTDPYSIRSVVKDCDVLLLKNTGHFPNLERPDQLQNALEKIMVLNKL
ncbi:MAG: pimeloyl-ACP methyl ester carboxylesterase [Thermoproteota archaeon]|jgi:pimeloyl-ACP methyl ester carboxylesterase